MREGAAGSRASGRGQSWAANMGANVSEQASGRRDHALAVVGLGRVWSGGGRLCGRSAGGGALAGRGEATAFFFPLQH